MQSQPIMIQYRAARALASIWRLNGLRLAQHTFGRAGAGSILTRPVFGGTMPIDVGRTSVHQLLYLEGERFVAERFLIRELLSRSMRVVDVGANIGYYLLLFEQVVGPDGRILCIEPEPDNVADLRRVVALNSFENVRVLAAALGAKQGEARLARGLNGMVVPTGGELNVPLLALDTIFDEGSLDRIDFIKIDVEGYEGEVLAGAARVIAHQHPRIFLEMHPAMLQGGHTVASIIATLEEHYSGTRQLECYELSSPTRSARLRAQYFGSNVARRVNSRELLASCATGERQDTFWVVCR